MISILPELVNIVITVICLWWMSIGLSLPDWLLYLHLADAFIQTD